MYCLLFPRPILSRDETPFVPVEERTVPKEHENLARHSEEVRIHARLRKMQEIVSQRIFPARPGTFSGLSHQDRDSKQDRPLCIVTVPSVQNK